MSGYNGYNNVVGLARLFVDFATVLDKCIDERETAEYTEYNRWGVGYDFVGHYDGKFITARRG